MNESKYTTYDYYTSNIQDNTINSLNPKEFDYNIVNNEHISISNKNISTPNTKLCNQYATRYIYYIV